MPKNIRTRVTIQAKPREVYAALLDSRRHARFTKARTAIDPRPGGRISCYDGYISGINLHLSAGKRIVQAWRGSDWAPGDFSIADFRFGPAPGGGTRLTLVQTGVPDEHAPSIRQGWIDYYWIPMKADLQTRVRKAAAPGPGLKKARGGRS